MVINRNAVGTMKKRRRDRGTGGRAAGALQNQEQPPCLVHVHCISLHALYNHRLSGREREGEVDRKCELSEKLMEGKSVTKHTQVRSISLNDEVQIRLN